MRPATHGLIRKTRLLRYGEVLDLVVFELCKLLYHWLASGFGYRVYIRSLRLMSPFPMAVITIELLQSPNPEHQRSHISLQLYSQEAVAQQSFGLLFRAQGFDFRVSGFGFMQGLSRSETLGD